MLSNSEIEAKDNTFSYCVILFLLILTIFSFWSFLTRNLKSYAGKETLLRWSGIKKLFLPCSYAIYSETDLRKDLKTKTCHILSLTTEEAVIMLDQRLNKKNNIVLNFSKLPNFPASDYLVKASVISCHNIRGDHEHYETKVKFSKDLDQVRKPILNEYLSFLAGPTQF